MLDLFRLNHADLPFHMHFLIIFLFMRKGKDGSQGKEEQPWLLSVILLFYFYFFIKIEHEGQ